MLIKLYDGTLGLYFGDSFFQTLCFMITLSYLLSSQIHSELKKTSFGCLMTINHLISGETARFHSTQRAGSSARPQRPLRRWRQGEEGGGRAGQEIWEQICKWIIWRPVFILVFFYVRFNCCESFLSARTNIQAFMQTCLSLQQFITMINTVQNILQRKTMMVKKKMQTI